MEADKGIEEAPETWKENQTVDDKIDHNQHDEQKDQAAEEKKQDQQQQQRASIEMSM